MAAKEEKELKESVAGGWEMGIARKATAPLRQRKHRQQHPKGKDALEVPLAREETPGSGFSLCLQGGRQRLDAIGEGLDSGLCGAGGRVSRQA